MYTTPHRSLIARRVARRIDRFGPDAQPLADVAALAEFSAEQMPADPRDLVDELVAIAAAAQHRAEQICRARALPALTHTDMTLSAAHARVIYLLADRSGATDEQLFRAWQVRVARKLDPWPFISEAGLRSRRAELTRWGLVEASSELGTTRVGRPSHRWQAVDPDTRPAGLVRVPPCSPDGFHALTEVLPFEPDADMVIRSVLTLVRAAASGATR